MENYKNFAYLLNIAHFLKLFLSHNCKENKDFFKKMT